MPSCAAIARGRRAKITLAGVMAFPNWRLIAQYMRRRNGFFGDSMGVMRMIVSCGDGRDRCMIAPHAPAVMRERQRREDRAEPDPERHVPHGATRAREAAHVTASIRTAGT